jgi:hypothetical protein
MHQNNQTNTTPNPPQTSGPGKVEGFAVSVKTIGAMSALFRLHRLLKQIDIAWPYLADVEDVQGKMTVHLSPAYMLQDYNVAAEGDQELAAEDIYLFYRPSPNTTAITEDYVENVIKVIAKQIDNFAGSAKFIPITTLTHPDWFYDYAEPKFTVSANNTMTEDIEDGSLHSFLPADITPEWLQTFENYCTAEVNDEGN